MKNLYVLLVGINDYTPPLPRLKGCIKDIDQIEKYLQDFAAEDDQLHIRRLENESATYANVIRGFREHLGAAGPADIAWFHFSGHGSEEKTAPEFLTLEPNGKDQTLICIDSGKNGVPHLADKELAVLLHELATRHPDGPPHTVVSLDCCHSGSGTRDAGQDMVWSTRAAPSSGTSRTLDSYIDGYFARQSQLEVPSSRHVLLSACKSVQTAGDMPQGGAFTTGLIKALKASQGHLSYTDLFLRARASVRQVRDNQTPQFETIQNFDPYTRFLDGTPAGERDLYEVIIQNGEWYVKCGAIHGLPTSPSAPIQLDIYTAPPEKELKGTATIKSVGAQLSRIDIEGHFGVGHFFRKLTSDETTYRASIRHLPVPPEPVRLTGDLDVIQSVLKDYKIRSHFIVWAQAEEPATIEVQFNKDSMTILDLEKSRKAFVTDGSSPDHFITITDALDKMIQWRRFIELENKHQSSRVKEMVRYELHEINEEGGIKKHTEGLVRIYATSQSMANRIPSFRPVVHLYNIRQPLYFYLFFVAYDYSVGCPDGEVVYRPSEHGDPAQVTIPLWKKTLGWGPARDHAEDTCHFKLLVTTEPLDYQQFLQSGLGSHRDILGEPTPQKVFDDWAAIDIAVTMVRQDNALTSSADISLADGNITIKAHPAISASVSIGHAETDARSSSPVHAFSRLQHSLGVEVVDFSPSRSVQVQNVIEINDIRIADSAMLQEQPLEMTLRQTVSDDELLLPVAFDGKHFRVVGDSVSDESGTHIRIREIPETDRTDSMEEGERSLFRSLKMTFCKVALQQEQVNQLRWVEMSADGVLHLLRESLGLKIGKAKNIMLVLPGLAGDGLTMVRGLYDNLPVDQLARYDLMLVYDYESLNTPLHETAAMLRQTLTDYGFGHDDRKLTLMTHSVGGLVARWMIEQDGGAAIVDHCILVGTPNNGSLYGRVDGYLKWAQSALELAINFIPDSIPYAGHLLKFFKGASGLTGSIGQIDPHSDFINKLNSSRDPGIRYTIVSGDAAMLDQSGEGYDGFIEKTRARLGNWINQDEPNDLFAPLRSLQCKELWEGRNPENAIADPVTAHHFGYFTSQGRTRDINTVWRVLAARL